MGAPIAPAHYDPFSILCSSPFLPKLGSSDECSALKCVSKLSAQSYNQQPQCASSLIGMVQAQDFSLFLPLSISGPPSRSWHAGRPNFTRIFLYSRLVLLLDH